MPAIKSNFTALTAFVTGLTRSPAGILLLVIIALAVPLTMAALMHLLEWHWWLALPAAILCVFIPIIGWLALIILAFFGGYYLIESGFDWQKATHAAQTAGSFSKMTIMEFDAYRRTVMPEGLAKACKEDLAKSLGTGSQLPVRASNYCECYGQASADTLTQADLAYQEKTGAYTQDAWDRMKDAVHSRCDS